MKLSWVLLFEGRRKIKMYSYSKAIQLNDLVEVVYREQINYL